MILVDVRDFRKLILIAQQTPNKKLGRCAYRYFSKKIQGVETLFLFNNVTYLSIFNGTIKVPIFHKSKKIQEVERSFLFNNVTYLSIFNGTIKVPIFHKSKKIQEVERSFLFNNVTYLSIFNGRIKKKYLFFTNQLYCRNSRIFKDSRIECADCWT